MSYNQSASYTSEQAISYLPGNIEQAWYLLPTNTKILIALALVAAYLAIRSAYRKAKLRRKRDLDPIKKAIYNPKQVRRPR
ncbi:hypothetical protein [Burkholderia thailandensis]|uniref:hypothetical protein n=1 Tax=Burkholderia thailandensis TaxID=57975 RepID=UPI002D79E727|nr:hypothetical protein [Burkholderia thailandensis]WRS65952.1 hypothetical protein U9S59_00950 [Burkholderia thailandensis]